MVMRVLEAPLTAAAFLLVGVALALMARPSRAPSMYIAAAGFFYAAFSQALVVVLSVAAYLSLLGADTLGILAFPLAGEAPALMLASVALIYSVLALRRGRIQLCVQADR